MESETQLLKEIGETLAAQKRLAERALQQLGEEDLHWSPDDESNSVAVIVKHMAGNMRSRWTEFLTSDGEKPDRDRDGEFVDDLGTADEVMAVWESGWQVLFDAVSTLAPGQLQQIVTVKGIERTVSEALLGQLGHYAQHVGQIVYLAKLKLGDRWETVSIPRKR